MAALVTNGLIRWMLSNLKIKTMNFEQLQHITSF